MAVRTSVLLLVVATMTANEVECKLDLSTASKRVDWTLGNSNGSISVAAAVPGGVYSDLLAAGVITDIFKGFNDVNTRWVAYDSWTYTGRFSDTAGVLVKCGNKYYAEVGVPEPVTMQAVCEIMMMEVAPMEITHDVVHLVFEGVDTVAFIELNDSPVGTTNNMFVRYVFDIKQHLKTGPNELKIRFASPVEAAKSRSDKHFTQPECVPGVYNGECHANQLRKMQASFAWDWGPAFPSVGLWKPAYIEFYKGAIIRSVTTHIEKQDDHWDLRIKAHLESSMERKLIRGWLSASLAVDGNQAIKIGNDLEIESRADGTAEAELKMTISENVVSLWWPNGYGEQPLYKLNVYLSSKGNIGQVSHKQIKIGFRTIQVVEEDPSLVGLRNNTPAGEGLTFYFKVNGYPLFMKGSNWIPAHILPENGAQTKIVDNLLNSAKDVHMTMLRVWGGGVYESDYFYSQCDQLGILVWQDFLFACSMYPVDPEFLETVKVEIEQNVINLQHHPSIAIWAGNNENEAALRGNWYNTAPAFDRYKEEYIKLYVDTIKPIVEGLDPGRRYVESSPSNGLKSVQEGYIAKDPYDAHYGDAHYYNYIADNWDQNIYPFTRFSSEYGVQSLPSIRMTMRTATTDEKDYSVDSEFSKHRQHLANGYDYIDNQMSRHLKLEKNDSKYFEKFVFHSQISQAMSVKAESEFYRQSQADWYTMGALYWQLNDVWQAPSWSGIESTGNWKMVHYFAMTFFAPVLISPRLLSSGVVKLYLLNDRFVPITDGTIKVDVFNWNSMEPIKTDSYPAKADALSAAKQDIELDLWNEYNQEEIFLRFSLKEAGVDCPPYNYIFPKPLKSVKGYKEPKVKITVSKEPKNRPDRTIAYNIDITTDSIVLFLWLETTYPHGYFYDNGLIITQPHTRITYINEKLLNVSDLQNSITIQYYVQ